MNHNAYSNILWDIHSRMKNSISNANIDFEIKELIDNNINNKVYLKYVNIHKHIGIDQTWKPIDIF